MEQNAATVTLDISTLTLGEMAEAEMASGRTLQELLRSPGARKILALFVHQFRNSGVAPSWSELANLRLLDASSSTLRSDSAETPAR